MVLTGVLIAGTRKCDVAPPVGIVGPPRELRVELVVEDEGHGLGHRVERLVEQLVLVLLPADLADGVASPGVLVQVPHSWKDLQDGMNII